VKNAQVLRQHGLKAKKSFGQNFLEDKSILARIAALCDVKPGATAVVEIGAGLGALTASLVEAGGHVVALERDRDLAPLLRARFQNTPQVEVVEANALTMDLHVLAARLGKLTVCGNLPYHLTSPLIFLALDQVTAWRRLVVMVQKEVADRMVAPPDNRTYGLLSVLLQGQLQVRRALDVPPHAFHPRPKIWSSVVTMEPLENPVPGADLPAYRRVAKAAFSARRKTLRNTLRNLLGETLDQVLTQAGVDPGKRAETLSAADFGRLTLAAVAANAPGLRAPPPPAEDDAPRRTKNKKYDPDANNDHDDLDDNQDDDDAGAP